MARNGSPLRAWRTIRHLRRRQILGQLHARLRRLYERPSRIDPARVGDWPDVRWSPEPALPAPGEQRNRAGSILGGELTFLNRTAAPGWPPRWELPELPRLWRYNLHYFEWLWALGPADAERAARDWIAAHDNRRGRVGWEPYPVALRLINWCAIFLHRDLERTRADAEWRALLWRSLWEQAEWLRGHLEVHLMGNHLFENGVALALVGSCFAGNDAERWYADGKRILEEQIPEQLLADGTHFERSPMYHQRITYLLLLLRNAAGEELRRRVEPPLARALEALARLCHPDGQIALLNDSAFGIYNPPSGLLELGGHGGPRAAGAWALPDAGYYGFRGAGGTYVVCDAGEVGPDYIPGHAHGDLFSFELSLDGQRVVVDSGVHDYEAGALRDYCRSTAAHNTVEIEGADQCEFWGVFRVARRARPHDVRWEPRADGFRLEGWHDGYRRLPGAPVHRRRFELSAAGALQIHDRVSAGRGVRCASRLHLHPDCRVESLDDDGAEVAHPGGRFRVRYTGPGRSTREPSHFCPEFGRRLDNVALVREWSGTRDESGTRIEPIR